MTARRFLWALALVAWVGTTGCAVSLKAGRHSFSSSSIESRSGDAALQVLEVEARVKDWLDEKVDLSASLGFVDAPAGTDFQDFRLTSRYHFRRGAVVSPYVGGGVGWYRWFAKEAVPVCVDFFCDLTVEGRDNDTLASGLFPHAVAGVNVRIGESTHWILEDRFDFQKDDDPFDLDSNQIVTGFRFDWN